MTARSLVASFCTAIFSLGVLHGADAEGFVPMFNGKGLSGWQTTGNWVVEADGTIALMPRKGEGGWTRYDVYLTTARTYKNFTIDLSQ